MLNTILYFLIGLLGINILVMFHEFGHYLAARACGIRVLSLKFGMGPAVFKWKHGETDFMFCAIPFGGATTMVGNDDLRRAYKEKHRRIENCEDGSIFSVTPFKRILTYLAGPFANVVFSVICLVILLVIPVLSVQMTNQVKPSSETSAAALAGIHEGDTIYVIDGVETKTWNDIQSVLSARKDKTVYVTTNRGTFSLTPVDGVFGLLPIGRYEEHKTPGKGLFKAIGLAFIEIKNQTVSFADAITGLFIGRTKLSDTLGGAFSASESMGMITERSFRVSFNTGIRVVLYLLASVSLSLGLANMLPIPALDGGLILISVVEIIAGRSLHPKTYVFTQILGLATVLVVIPVLRIFL